MKRVIVSGYFNPLHGGHLDLIENGRKLGDYLIVIVNNDDQQLLKKGKIIVNVQNRARVMRTLRPVDEVIISIDKDPSVVETLKSIALKYSDDELIFGNGGDRNSIKAIPETAVCNEYDIELVFGLAAIVDSSTRINQALGHEG
jgi:glycerol-3-phosphate cytidylyltransferase/D-beta-D-heptose 7-phosphate kinase/D-beta-D-heptose 1-phosphate adenosyltransferase